MATEQQKPGKAPRIKIALAVLICAGGILAFALPSTRTTNTETPEALTFAAVRGPLTIAVSEAGTIKSRNQEVIKSEVEGQTLILFLVPEGTQVKKGDLLVELDASKLQDQRVDKQITVQNAEANFIRARESLEVLKNQAQADIAKAELDFQFAGEDLQKYEQGDYPMAIKEAESKVSLAQNELERITEKLKQSRELYARNFTALTEVQADELTLKRAELDIVLTREQLKLLKEFTYKRRMTELRSNQEQTRLALQRIKRKAAADLVQGEADLKAKQSEYDRQKTQLAKVMRQIDRTRMFAPTHGLVVYATTGQSNMRMSAEPLGEGQSVRERQDIIYLPTTSSVMAEVKIHESSLDKVRRGLPVRITVDALPGKVYSGTLAKIAPLPDAQSVWMNPDLKVYNTEITLEGDGGALRTGMSCRAEIIVDQYADATYVPVQAVLRVGGKPSVYVVEKGQAPQRREIEMGLDNNRMAHVVSGLKEGERVLLNPPLAEAAAAAEKSAATGQPPPATGAGKPAASPTVPPAAGGSPPSVAPADAPPPPPAVASQPEPGAQAGDAPREGRGPRRNLTPEQREAMRKQFENMSPEEREKARQTWTQRKPAEGGDGGARNGGGAGRDGGTERP